MKYISAFLMLLILSSPTHADIIFKSGTLGATGLSFPDIFAGAAPSINVNEFVYSGVRFPVTKPVKITSIGGHFVERLEGTFFGAIVELDNANDFPDSGDFSTPDFLGSTLLEFPELSDEVTEELNLSLDPGHYALVFGSGLFGATGSGVAVRNGTDIGSPSYIGGQPSTPGVWSDISLVFPDSRFFLNGVIIPEPTSIALLPAALIFLMRV